MVHVLWILSKKCLFKISVVHVQLISQITYLLTYLHVRMIWQVTEHKKRYDEEHALIESFDETKKKMLRDTEALQHRIDALTQENDKLNKSKRNIQAEVQHVYRL